MAEFTRLGFKEVFTVSAAHGRGISDLIESIEAKLPAPPPEVEEEELLAADGTVITKVLKRAAPRVAILGRPNVGKSSLTNAILKDDRTIVSDIAGTTRDAVDIPHVFNGRPYVLIDTAGMRHRSRHNTSAEVFSVMRSEKSVHRADLCVLVVDAADGVTRMDRQIAGLIQEARKPCVLLLNKWDLIDKVAEGKALKDFRKEFLDSTASELFFLDHAPLIAISAKEKTGIGKVFAAIEEIRAAALAPTPTGPLNRLLQIAMEKQPPRTVFNKRFKLLYATRTNDERAPTPIPVPRFIFFCNDERLLTADYRRYLEKAIRKEHPFPGLPITIRLRGREKAK
jgi:GTP-binding protein